MTYDGATWGAFACVLSALGAVLTYLAWQRRGLGAAVRGAGWTIVPIAAWLTGTLRLVAEVVGDVGDWATRLVFSPTVWLGICLAAVAVVLIGAGGALARRSAAKDGRPPSRRVRTRARKADGPAEVPSRKNDRLDGLDGLDDVEAILRKHGIS